MWNPPPEARFAMAKMRQEELRTAAVEARRTSRAGGSHQYFSRVKGLNLRLGRLSIVVGRTLRKEESPCPDMAN